MNTTIPSNVLNLLTKKGQFVSLHTKRPMKVRKGVVDNLEKDSTFVVRIGVDYDNIKAVQEKRESGELPEQNAGLKPNFKWVHFPVLLQNEKSGEFYIRCSKGANTAPKTKYFKNGIEVKKDDIQALCLAVEFPKTERNNDVFDIKVSNIIELKA